MIFGVDIGGTEIKFGLFSNEGELLDMWASPTDLSNSGRRIIPDITKIIKTYADVNHIALGDLSGIGLGIPGPVDKDGHVRNCVNLHWNDFNPVEELRRDFPNLPIEAANDANVAALGEYYRGAGKAYGKMMLVTLGTGVGGGIVLDGNILLGAHGVAGEIGHIGVVPYEEERCNCGNAGCIDQFASATGIVRIMKKLLSESSRYSGLRECEALTAKKICESAQEGDALAMQCIEICMEALGTGLAFFTHAFDPEAFIIGGGVSKAGELIIRSIEKGYNKNLFLIQEGARIQLAELGNDAGITGACMLIVNRREL